ncbi:MAG TPA: DUF262 domain-containing protein [Fimbriimonadaceae bacterium]|nr:DUF262 domain-containing protein [Fimbriimonadaceae bacterium]
MSEAAATEASGDDVILEGLEDEFAEVLPYRYSITAYGADFLVDGLVTRLAQGDIFVPSFQREYVWTLRDASRFVESLLLGLPVPGIFLSREKETERLLVIDGQQRLLSLQYFYSGIFEPTGARFALRGVQPQLEGKTISTLSPEDRRRLTDSILHATIVRQDTPSDDDSSIYHIFERLNTGGRLLFPQEIRAAIYHGPLDELLRELNEADPWRAIFGPPSRRMRDRELILRFFALLYDGDSYQRPMKAFLNRYMASNRDFTQQSAQELTEAFLPTITQVNEALGSRAFRPRRSLNAAVFEAVMVGLARRLLGGAPITDAELVQRYEALIAAPAFVSATELRTSDEPSVATRLELGTTAFAA